MENLCPWGYVFESNESLITYMKKQLFTSYLALATLVVSITAKADDYEWSGSFGEAMINGANWIGGVSPVWNDGDNHLIFGNTDQHLVYQDISGSYLNIRGITFLQGAPGYTLYGDPLRVHALQTFIRNQSVVQQIIENDILIDEGGAGGWGTAGLVIDTGHAGVLWRGSSSYSGQNTIWKSGTGDLVVAGSHYIDSTGSNADWRVLAGTLVLDMANGGQITKKDDAEIRIVLGANVGANFANNAHFRLVGYENGVTESAVFGLMGWEDSYGRRTISVDSNGGSAELRLGAFGNGNSGTGSSIHLDLSTANSSITTTGPAADFSGHSAGASGLYYAVTINDGNGIGFATYVDNSGTKSYARYTGAFTELNGEAIGHNTNYYLEEGKTTTHTTDKNAFLFGTTLTIRNTDGSGGSFVNNSGSGGMYFYGLLMEAGVGDYIFNPLYGNGIAGGGNHGMVVHQYSTDGDLIFANGIQGAYEKAFIKTGPGTVVLQGTSPHAQPVYVQQGLLRVEGTLLNAEQWIVYDSASLGGPGSVKTNQNLIVMDGGTLVGTNHTEKGLSIETASGLDLRAGSNYFVEIGDNRLDPLAVTGNILLAGNLDLVLVYAPELNDSITLLTFSGSRTGEFASINGGLFGGDNDDEFVLVYGGMDYSLRIEYGVGQINILVTAVPEPGTMAVWFGIGGLVFFLYRKRKK